jgi:ATP-dependent helicase HrpA
VRREYEDLLADLPPARRDADEVREIGWMIEETPRKLPCSGFGHVISISDKRIYRAMDRL